MNEYRWRHYSFYRDEDCLKFWNEYFSGEKKVLFITNLGFDPRMTQVLQCLVEMGVRSIKCLLIAIEDKRRNLLVRSYKHVLAEKNFEKLKTLLSSKSDLIKRNISMWSEDEQKRIVSREVTKIIDVSDLMNYTDVVIDISSISRGIYGSLLVKILHLIDGLKGTHNVNMHIVGAENPKIDQLIKSGGLDEFPNYLHLLQRNMHLKSLEKWPKVWIPILGEYKKNGFEKTLRFFEPDEICPILPFPSSVPRRSDDILLEYCDPISKQIIFGSNNIMYSSEYNPFDTYRQIMSVVTHYAKSLEPLEGVRFIISSFSSKTLTLGAILATYELIKQEQYAIGMTHIFPNPYDLKDLKNEEIDSLLENSVFFTSLLDYPMNE